MNRQFKRNLKMYRPGRTMKALATDLYEAGRKRMSDLSLYDLRDLAIAYLEDRGYFECPESMLETFKYPKEAMYEFEGMYQFNPFDEECPLFDDDAVFNDAFNVCDKLLEIAMRKHLPIQSIFTTNFIRKLDDELDQIYSELLYAYEFDADSLSKLQAKNMFDLYGEEAFSNRAFL